MSSTETTTGRPSARRAATRARLTEAATRVFARKGVGGSSVEEICEEAGFTRGAFYSNFASKNDLCGAILQRYIDTNIAALIHALGEIPAECLDTDEALNRVTELFIEAVGRDPDLVLAISDIRLQAARDPRLREEYLAVGHNLTPAFSRIIEEMVPSDEQHQMRVPVPQLVGILQSVYDQQMIEAIITKSRVDHEEVGRQLAAVVEVLLGM